MGARFCVKTLRVTNTPETAAEETDMDGTVSSEKGKGQRRDGDGCARHPCPALQPPLGLSSGATASPGTGQAREDSVRGHRRGSHVNAQPRGALNPRMPGLAEHQLGPHFTGEEEKGLPEAIHSATL